MYLKYKDKQACIPLRDLEKLLESLGLLFVIGDDLVSVFVNDKVLELQVLHVKERRLYDQ